MPLISIIMPTLNSENTIARAMQSLNVQDFLDFELIIIDGKSTDNTINIIESFNVEYDVRVYIENDKGIYDAMNKGINLSKGEWLYFLGSDDKLFRSTVFLNLAKHLINSNFDVIYGDVYSDRFKGIYDNEFDAEKLIKKNICHQAIFFKKTVFEIIGTFKIKYVSHADWEHNLRWFFTPKLTHKYVNLTIADYADGGFSSRQGDDKFRKLKKIKLIYYSFSYLQFSDWIKYVGLVFKSK